MLPIMPMISSYTFCLPIKYYMFFCVVCISSYLMAVLIIKLNNHKVSPCIETLGKVHTEKYEKLL